MRAYITLFLAFSLFVCSNLMAQEPPDELKKMILAGREQVRKGQIKEAVQTYQKADEVQRKEKVSEYVISDTTLERARVLEINAAKDPGSAGQAISLYSEVIQNGTPQQAVLARNNLANFQVQQKNFQSALATYKALNFSFVPVNERFLFHYNYGKVLELNGNPAEASDQYQAAVADQPLFSEAIQAASNVILNSPQPDLKRATDFVTLLINQGQLKEARAQLMLFINKWGGSEQGTVLLFPLLDYYGIAQIKPEEFRSEETKDFDSISKTYPNLKQPLSEIQHAYSDPMRPTPFSSMHLVYWSDGTRRIAFSRFVGKVAEIYSRENDYNGATARYLAAWNIDRTNSSAVVNAAALLDEQASVVDPSHTLINALVDKLFNEKMGAYQSENWLDVLRLHSILGTIFEKESRWGTPFDPRSAIFQWEHALKAEERLISANADFPRSGDIRVHLANCYRSSGQAPSAWSQYVTAAEIFLSQDDVEQTHQAVEQAKNLNISLSEDQISKISSIEAQIVPTGSH